MIFVCDAEPTIPRHMEDTDHVAFVASSETGFCEALRGGTALVYDVLLRWVEADRGVVGASPDIALVGMLGVTNADTAGRRTRKTESFIVN